MTLCNDGHLIQSAENLKSKDRFREEEAILPQDCNVKTLPEFPACLPCPVEPRLKTAVAYATDFGLASPHSQMIQFLQ